MGESGGRGEGLLNTRHLLSHFTACLVPAEASVPPPEAGMPAPALTAREEGDEVDKRGATTRVCILALMLPGCVASGGLLNLSVPLLWGQQCLLHRIIKRVAGEKISRHSGLSGA